MTKTEMLFEIGRVCPDMANEIMALQKRLDKDDEFVGPAKEANERRFAKLCRDALQTGDFPDSLRKKLEDIEATLTGPGRPAMDPDEKRKARSIKMSDEEWDKMKELAEQAGVSVAELIRMKVLAGD
jgi:hypothetical protein